MNVWTEHHLRRWRARMRHLLGKGQWAYLWDKGLRPATILDIGVAQGTYELYEAYPDAHYLLFDPTPQSLPFMQLLQRQLLAEIHPIALGDRNGTATLDVRDDMQGSTLFADAHPNHVVKPNIVPMKRLDCILQEARLTVPIMCKIDVQGAELMVLQGMGEYLQLIDWLIVEVSTIATLQGGPEFYDVVSFMSEKGYVIGDILSTKQRPLDGATAQVDLLFIPRDDPTRTDKRWRVEI